MQDNAEGIPMIAVAVRAGLVIALFLLSSGCCTAEMWSDEGLPYLDPKRVLGAALAEDGTLTIGLEFGNGDRGKYAINLNDSIE